MRGPRAAALFAGSRYATWVAAWRGQVLVCQPYHLRLFDGKTRWRRGDQAVTAETLIEVGDGRDKALGCDGRLAEGWLRDQSS